MKNIHFSSLQGDTFLADRVTGAVLQCTARNGQCYSFNDDHSGERIHSVKLFVKCDGEVYQAEPRRIDLYMNPSKFLNGDLERILDALVEDLPTLNMRKLSTAQNREIEVIKEAAGAKFTCKIRINGNITAIMGETITLNGVTTRLVKTRDGIRTVPFNHELNQYGDQLFGFLHRISVQMRKDYLPYPSRLNLG